MKRYENMSAVPTKWLGVLPSHWDCKKIGLLFSERKIKVSDKDYPPLSVTKIGVVPQLATAVKTDAGDNRKLVCAGDFVINSRSDRKGSCGVADKDGSVSLINIVLTPRSEWNRKYVHYLMRCQLFSEEYYRYGRGIVADLWTTRFSEMKNILLPVPPRPEQDQIVRFLDWKVSSINKLINHYKHEISMLGEMKQKLIDKVVIKGLHETKYTHNEDLGWYIDYPSHWAIQRIRESFNFRKGLSITKADLKETGIAVISYGQIHSKKNSGVGLTGELIRFVNEDYLSLNPNALVEKGDFIFADTSEDLAGCGNCAYIDWDNIIFAGYHSIIAHPTKINSNKYFAYLFKSSAWRYQIRKKVNAVKVYSITQRILKDAFILIPPMGEQQEIVEYLDHMCLKVEALISKIEDKIQNLQDYKISITADVVVGKIDVRDIEIPEYEFVSEDSGDRISDGEIEYREEWED